MADVKIEHRTVDVFDIRAKHEYAKFIIDSTPGHHTLAIDSSYGGFAFAWTHPGGCFYEFLAGLNRGYATVKLVGRVDEKFDPERTALEIKQAIIAFRKDRTFTKSAARDEWNLLEDFEHEGHYWDWLCATQFEDGHEFYRTKPGPQSEDFGHLYDLFWPLLAKTLHDRCTTTHEHDRDHGSDTAG